MRIALIAPPWLTVPPTGYGGIERVVAELADGLVARGHDVTLFASGGSQTNARLVSPLEQPPDPAEMGNVWDETYHAHVAYLTADEFDVIHDHSGPIATLIGVLAAPAAPIVHTLHGPWTPRARRHYARLDQQLRLIAISRAQQRSNPLVRYSGVVHNGLSPAGFPTDPAAAMRTDTLVFLGRSSPEKGPRQAIEIARRAGRPLLMLVKCAEPAEVAYWRREVEPFLGRDVEVIFDADHDTKVAALSSAAALVFPIDWDEPFGLAMIEALACGTPVVAPARGSVPEIVVEGECGFVVDAKDVVGSSVAALDRLGELDPVACRARFDQAFSSQHMVAAYEATYQRLIGSRSRVADRSRLDAVGLGGAGGA